TGQLTRFYSDCILPELVDPRVERSVPVTSLLWNAAAVDQQRKQTTNTQVKTKGTNEGCSRPASGRA
ncbi:MAG: hypothetical protein O7D30_12805, partial [Rickettsia endosymbiont of Ixodes persulcatus]|nr:hypothetical protein [Rickettsia endosymbiont of Ixodes persulcatus]